jgi:hypothetical protein
MKHALVPLLVALLAAAGESLAQSGQRATPPLVLHPGALTQMINELGGREVTLMRAKVVSMLSPQALLIESAGSLEPAPGFYNRVIVLVHGGTIRLAPTALVGSTVHVTGVARTVLGMQVSREVAWPPALTSDVVRRYEIRAAVLASFVESSDGVPLVTRNGGGIVESGDAR